jgi:hypothetical protein
VDESLTDAPTVIEVAESEVVMVGLALMTVRGSQGDVAGLLPESPE